jgi:hypothetical protein
MNEVALAFTFEAKENPRIRGISPFLSRNFVQRHSLA